MTTAHEQLKEQYEQSLESQEGFYLSAKAVEALLTEHRAVREWRDIESAPKDGTKILYYEVGISGDMTTGFYCPTREKFFDDAYQVAGYPTHWMPLPTPPSPEAGNE